MTAGIFAQRDLGNLNTLAINKSAVEGKDGNGPACTVLVSVAKFVIHFLRGS
jgi:hypothetical protein